MRRYILPVICALLLLLLCEAAAAENIPGEWIANEEITLAGGTTFNPDIKVIRYANSREKPQFIVSDRKVLKVSDSHVQIAKVTEEKDCYLTIYSSVDSHTWHIRVLPTVQRFYAVLHGEVYKQHTILLDSSYIGKLISLSAQAWPESASQEYTFTLGGSKILQQSKGGYKVMRRGECTMTIRAQDGSKYVERIKIVVADLSSFPYYIEVDKGNEVVRVYEKDENGLYTKLVRRMICSSGKHIANLPTGLFRITGNRHAWMGTVVPGIYVQYGVSIWDKIYFHSLPYTHSYDGSSMEVADYNALGKPVSGGCIRLLVADCKWIYENISRNTFLYCCNDVRVESECGAVSTPPLVSTWDPTDDDPKNPDYDPTYTSLVR